MTKGNWVTITLFGIGYLIAGLTSFQGLNSRVTILEASVVNHGFNHYKEFESLKKEDILQENAIHDLSDNYIRLDAKADSTRESVEKLEATLHEVLQEIKQLNQNVIKLGVLQDMKKFNKSVTKLNTNNELIRL